MVKVVKVVKNKHSVELPDTEMKSSTMEMPPAGSRAGSLKQAGPLKQGIKGIKGIKRSKRIKGIEVLIFWLKPFLAHDAHDDGWQC